MADQLNMGGLNLGPDGQQGGPQQPGGRSYIPPHMRGRGGPAPGPGPVPNGAPPAMNGGPPPGPPMNGINQSAWAKYVPELLP
jgi:ATP-dependent RNA helicase DDX3X